MCSNNVCRQALSYPLSGICSIRSLFCFHIPSLTICNHTPLTCTSSVRLRIPNCIHPFHYAFVIFSLHIPRLPSLSFTVPRYTIYADPTLTPHTNIYAVYCCCILSLCYLFDGMQSPLCQTLMKTKRRDCASRHPPRRLPPQPCRLPHRMPEWPRPPLPLCRG